MTIMETTDRFSLDHGEILVLMPDVNDLEDF